MQKKPQIAKTAPVRVRFAPSPTGFLHLGGARTALFNWLFARKMGGVFVLRIEDTDAERSSEESTAGILEAMRWLGLDWDEGPEVGGDFGPYQQSLRHVVYRAEADRLVREGRAYPCFCTREDVDAMRERASRAGESLRYDGRCGRIDESTRARYVEEGRPSVIRSRMPSGEVRWNDFGRGQLRFDLSELDDFVLLKSDGNPTYNFAVVVDDAKMRISTVIRGDDHISNTPKQLVLYEALGFPRPDFAHLPMIVGQDKTRLSKRHGATSVTWFRDAGFLPSAMVNYLALLGWAYDGKRELFTPEELVSCFDLKNVSRNPAVFDMKKLEWMNHEHFSRLPLGSKIHVLLPEMRKHGLWPPRFRVDLSSSPHLRVVTGSTDEKVAATIQPLSDEEWMLQEPSLSEELPRLKLILEAVGSRLGGPHEVTDVLGYFYSDDIAFDPEAVAKHLSGEEVPARLRSLADTLAEVKPFTPDAVETALRGLAERLGLKAGALIHPARVSLTGQKVSPGIFDVFFLLGRMKSVERLRRGADIVERNRELSPPDPA
jgi:glutamyl-tRNA synthetase